MWTEITRAKYDRSGLRYTSDVTDAEWALILPHLPPEKPLGRRRETNLREVVNALLYMATTGCQWRMLPDTPLGGAAAKDFPPYSTVQDYFYPWSQDGTWMRINHALVMAAREHAEREPSPSAGVIDSQSVDTQSMGRRSI